MKSRIAHRMFLIALTTTLATSMAATARADGSLSCSPRSVAGKWAFTINGTIPSIGPVGAVGLFTQDASGNFNGTETRSLNGDSADETLTGTATVNPDCSGTDTIQVFEGGVLVRTSTLAVVYDDNKNEARALFTSVILPDGTVLPSILTSEAHKLLPKD